MKRIFNLSFTLVIIIMSNFLAACSSSETNTEPLVPEVTPSLSVPTKNYNIMQKGETIKIAISTNQSDVDVEIPDDCRSWIHLGSKNTQSISLVIDENSDYETRTASVRIKAGTLSETITLTQQGYVVLNLSQTEYTISDAGGDVYIDTESNFEYEVSIDVDWIQESSCDSRAISKSTIVLNVLPNENYDSREAKITFRDPSSQYKKTLTLIQAQKNAIVLAKNSYEIDEDGLDLTFEVGANVDYDIKVNDAWVSQKISRALSYNELTFVVSPNFEAERTTTISFVNKDLDMEQSITIKQKAGNIVSGIIDGHDYVDLGLPSGLKWATCNVGANTSEEFGNYYSWSETSTKSDYSSSNCFTHNTFYSILKGMNIVDSNDHLTKDYDAATVNWGGNWRMPTIQELSELIKNCTCKWVSRKGIYGMKITSIINGNSIFLPAAGEYDGTTLKELYNEGNYWSSTASQDSFGAYFMKISQSKYYCSVIFARYPGFCVRPVSE